MGRGAISFDWETFSTRRERTLENIKQDRVEFRLSLLEHLPRLSKSREEADQIKNTNSHLPFVAEPKLLMVVESIDQIYTIFTLIISFLQVSGFLIERENNYMDDYGTKFIVSPNLNKDKGTMVKWSVLCVPLYIWHLEVRKKSCVPSQTSGSASVSTYKSRSSLCFAWFFLHGFPRYPHFSDNLLFNLTL